MQTMKLAILDIAAASKRISLITLLGWQDVKQRYRRSALGPFWLTISMGVMIGTIGVVFGQIFKAPMGEFLPFLAAGMILWSFISTTIGEGCFGFIAAEGVIKQLPIPLFSHVLRMMWRNILIFLHNIVIFPLVLVVMMKPIGFVAFLSIPGFFLLLINLLWISLVLGILCARYRDLPQMVTSLLQVVFYLTPIMWMPKLLDGRIAFHLLSFNPFYHLIEIVRAPLMGELPDLLNWEVSIGFAVVGWIIALVMYGTYKNRIAYWL